MICRNCNTENIDGSVFCQNCGQRIGQVCPAAQQTAPVYQQNVQPQQNFTPAMPQPQTAGAVQPKKPGGLFVKAKTLRIWSTILLLICIPAILFVCWECTFFEFLTARSFFETDLNFIRFLISRSISDSFMASYINLIFINLLTIVVPVLFWWRFTLYSKAKKQNTGYCPKCRQITPHNRFAICTECQIDYFSHCLACAVIVTLGTGIKVFAEFTYNSGDTYRVFIIIFFALWVLALIFPPFVNIYMYPSRMARKTGHAAAGAIFWLNIFLGGTIIFWIILLIWASSGTGNIESKMNAMQASPTGSLADQFAELQKLKEMGAITDQEFEQKRQQLLQRL